MSLLTEFNKAHKLYKEKKHTEALSALDLIIKKAPRWAGAYNLRGLVYLSQVELEKALADFNKAIELYPDYRSFWHNRGNILFRQGNYQEAITDFTRAYKFDNNPSILADRGYAYMRLGDYEQALADLNAALNTAHSPEEDLNNYLVVRAQIYEALDEPRKAQEEYENIFKQLSVKEPLAVGYATLKIQKLSGGTTPECKLADPASPTADLLLVQIMKLHHEGQLEKAKELFQKLMQKISTLHFIPFEKEVIELQKQLPKEKKPAPLSKSAQYALERLQKVYQVEKENAEKYQRAKKCVEEATYNNLPNKQWEEMISNLKQAVMLYPYFLAECIGILRSLEDKRIAKQLYKEIFNTTLNAAIPNLLRMELLEIGVVLEKTGIDSFVVEGTQAKALLKIADDSITETGILKNLATPLSSRVLHYVAANTTAFLMQELKLGAQSKDTKSNTHQQLCRIEKTLASRKLDLGTISDLAEDKDLITHVQKHCSKLFKKITRFELSKAKSEIRPTVTYRNLNSTI